MRIAGAAALLIAALAWAPPASAQSNLTGLTESVDTGGVLVRYTSAAGDPRRIEAATAGTLAANAQASLAAQTTRLGMPPPLDPKVDVYVTTIPASTEEPYGRTVPRTPGNPQSAAYIAIQPSKATEKEVITHEMFHVLQNAVSVGAPKLLSEGLANWAGYHLNPDTQGLDEYPPRAPLDCASEAECAGQNPGYTSWPFWEFASERFGESFGRQVYDQQALLGRGAASTAALDAALKARGSNLSAAFREFASKSLQGDFTGPLLKGETFALASPAAEYLVGTKSKKLPTRRFTLDRLSTAYLEITREGSRCRPGRLKLQISGASTPMTFIAAAPAGKRTRAAKISRGRAGISVAFKSCRRAGLNVALINAAPAAGGKVTFKVAGAFEVR
ncbi:MAG: hypothetical protein H0T15_02650 [Thermoleophilaceae bacterium]|nr:hypothetical protein [Thermoleophilaceae bacterium]